MVKTDFGKHVTSIHKGLRYSCNQCDYKLENQIERKCHIEAYHDVDFEDIKKMAVETYGSDDDENINFQKEQIYEGKLWQYGCATNG